MNTQIQVPRMELEWKEVKEFKTLIKSVINTKNDYINMKFNQDGLMVNTLKPGSSMIVMASFPKEYFNTYECTQEFIFSIKSEELEPIVKRFKKNSETLNMRINDESRLVLKSGNKVYENRVEKEKDEVKEVKKFAFGINIVIPQLELKEILDDAIINEKRKYDNPRIFLEVANNKLQLTRFTDTTNYKTEIESSEKVRIQGQGKEKYNVGYLHDLVSSFEGVGDIIITFQAGQPIVVTYDHGYITGAIAPMM